MENCLGTGYTAPNGLWQVGIELNKLGTIDSTELEQFQEEMESTKKN